MTAAILMAILVIALSAISLALVIGISLGIGWVLTLFLPFSLFEGTLLGMIAAIVTAIIWYDIIRSISREEEEDDSETDEIPQTRFWGRGTERTWENWFRYLMANSIYEDLLESSHGMGDTSEGQLQELSIHLADAAIGVLQAKSPRIKRLRMSRGMLKQEMVQMGHPTYEDDILDIAVAAINVKLADMEKLMKEVIREQLWDEKVADYE